MEEISKKFIEGAIICNDIKKCLKIEMHLLRIVSYLKDVFK